MKLTAILIISLLTVIAFIPDSYAEIIHNDAGTINNLVIDHKTTYFFELDRSKQSPTWIPDTNIYAHDDSGVRLVSDNHFIFPMELTEHGNYLYFSKLEDSCMGSIMCDYQDLVRMSKTDGSFEVIANHLKSAIRISVEDNGVYVSESSGKIWRFNHDGTDPKLLYETNGIIIMDMMTENDGTIYWIEEIEDLNNSILKKESNSEPTVIASNLAIPYDLKDYHGQFWNEIYIGAKGGSSGEFTKIIKHTDSENIILGDFKNTSPLSDRQYGSHYGPYLIVGDYLLFSNNTSDSVIHMRNTITDQTYDIATVDYNVEFMRAAEDSLYVVGSNNNGFLIDKITLPVSVPEFSSIAIVVLFTGIVLSVILLRRFKTLQSPLHMYN